MVVADPPKTFLQLCEKLHLSVFTSDPHNSPVWKTGILEAILPTSTVFTFSFSVCPNPAILKEDLCLSFFCVAPLRKVSKKLSEEEKLP